MPSERDNAAVPQFVPGAATNSKAAGGILYRRLCLATYRGWGNKGSLTLSRLR
jgi:hypothetical protein